MTRLPSLQLGIDGGGGAGDCDSGYSCAYDKLQAQQEGEGQSLLQQSAVFCSSDISDGNSHNHDDMPIILAGHGGGALTPGQHISYAGDVGAPKEKVANLLVTMLEAAGVAGAQLGDSTGPLREL